MADDHEIITVLIVAGAGIAAALSIFLVGRRVGAPHLKRGMMNSVAHPILSDNDGPSEKRSAFRRGGSQVAVLLNVQEPAPRQHSGWVVDRCPSGLGIMLDDTIPTGTVVKVRTTKSVGITVEMVVRQSRQDNRCCFVGCEFINRPSTEVLWQFG
jgi:hypothetical protein